MGTSSINEEICLDDLKKVDSSTFFDTLNEAKKQNSFGAYVTLHDTVEYDKCKALFLHTDKSCGVAIEADGNIISVFRSNKRRGVLPFLIAKAIEAGGIKLDCFGSNGLKSLYVRRGFIPISKTKFNRKFAPKDWNYERDGMPDIIFWIYDTCRDNPFVDSNNNYSWESIPEFPSYKKAEQYRNKMLTQ